MILGLGCDIALVSRFAKDKNFMLHFIKKYFTTAETEELQDKIENPEKGLVLELATRFAAKEAVAKALGTGFQFGITLKDIEVTHNDLGCPEVKLYNKALARAYQVTHNQDFIMHITLSNEKEYANAVAVLESK